MCFPPTGYSAPHTFLIVSRVQLDPPTRYRLQRTEHYAYNLQKLSGANFEHPMLFSSSTSSTFQIPAVSKPSSFSMKRTATILGGLYLVGRYVKDRLEDTKEGIMQERMARDNLKRRFNTNQQNVSYTVLALISTLSEQITEGMDVEALTAELQSLSSRKTTPVVVPTNNGAGAAGAGHEEEHKKTIPRVPLPTNPDPGATSLLPPQPHDSTPTTSSDALSLSLPSAAPSSSPDPDAQSDVGSTSTSQSILSSNPSFSPPNSQSDSSGNDLNELNELNLSQSSTSWMTDNVSMIEGASPSAESMELVDAVSESEPSHHQHTPDPLAASYLSTATTNTTSSSMLSYPQPIGGTSSQQQLPEERIVSVPPAISGRTKAELWNEIKIMTLTRTLTTLYSTTLLSLFTSLQLTLLSRSAYVHSVIRQSKDEEREENVMRMLGGGGMIGMALAMCPIKSVRWFVGADSGVGGKGVSPEEQLFSLLQQPQYDNHPTDANDNAESDDTAFGFGVSISDEVERKYLTLSWWMLHVGWKDVGERVRKGVEDVLEGVSLKTKLGIIDLHRLISDIRRRVEHEITFEGRERRIDFLSTLLPPTPEMTQRVLSEGGFFPSSSPLTNPHFPPLPGSTLSQSGLESPPEPSITSFEESHRLVDEEAHPPNQPNPTHPPSAPPSPEDEQFNSLLDETRQVISSPDFARVLEVCMERAVEALFDDLEKEVYFPYSLTQRGAVGDDDMGLGSGSGGEEVRIRLAALLPGLTSWSRDVLNGLPNVLVDTLINTREVVALSAILFAKFEDQVVV